MDTDKIAKLIRMLSSSNNGEVLNAARMLTRMGIHDVAALVEGGGSGSGLRKWGRKVAHLEQQLEETRAELEATRAAVAKVGAPKVCVVCGESFIAKRSDAITCSGACRVRLHRRQRRK